MAYTIKQARPILLGYLGLTEVNADYIPNTDNWGIRFTKNGLDCVIFVMPLGENTSSPKIYFDVRDSGAEKFVAAWEYAETHNLKFFCLGVKDINDTYKDSVISIEADIKTVLNVSGLENGRRSGSGTQLNIPKSLVPNGNVNRKKSDRFNIFYAVIDKNFILNYLESFDNRLFQFIAEPAHLDDNTEPTDIAGVSRNRIVFGAPGTGKSFQLKEESTKDSPFDLKGAGNPFEIKFEYYQIKILSPEPPRKSSPPEPLPPQLSLPPQPLLPPVKSPPYSSPPELPLPQLLLPPPQSMLPLLPGSVVMKSFR